MARKPLLIVVSVGGAAAVVLIVLGVVSGERAPVPVVASAPAPQVAEAPMTAHSPAVASNARLTIRLVGGQSDR